ncbi:ABC transporter substrate-binding protein [Sediminibacillus albus]|uniref:ABC transporter substrate-binding protein n=1 Tax=Sediminibacillus albus TaxID=407036 RepID=UPI000B81FD8A|nr:ABC transporter substrate-binding protein [Sediminibacillus albus]
MKKGLLLSFCLFVVLGLAACSGGSSITEESGTGTTDGKQEILLWHYYTGSEEYLNELLDEFNQSQEDVHVKSEYVPFSDIKKQLSIGSAGGNLPDIIISDTVDNAALASMGVLADITEKVESWQETENFLQSPLQSTVYEEKHYGMPLTSNALGLFYNKGIFEEAGIAPPETWKELKEAAAELTTDERKGLGISAVKSEEATFQFYPFLYSAGGDYQHLASKEANKALSLIKDMLEAGSMSEDILSSTQDDLATKFSAEQLAMMVNGPWMIERLKEANPDMDFGIVPIPKDQKVSSVLGGDNIEITKEANVDASWEFLTWLLAPEQIEGFTRSTGYFPPRQDVLNESDYWKNDEYLKAFIPIMEAAEARGPSPDWPKISEAIQIAIQESLTDSKSVEAALEDAAAKVNELE